MSADEIESLERAAAAQDGLCAHGCGNEATIQHADLRFLCALCYSTEVTSGMSASDCPTCGAPPE